MIRTLTLLFTFCALPLAIACSGEEAKDVAAAASDHAEHAGKMADDAMGEATGAAQEAAATVAGNAVATCRQLAEQGAWGQALDVCKKAHEMMPDDLALEHAYQQAMAASGR